MGIAAVTLIASAIICFRAALSVSRDARSELVRQHVPFVVTWLTVSGLLASGAVMLFAAADSIR